jgi:hypothetical protein
VRCAVRRGIIQEWEKMEDLLGDAIDEHFMPVFCLKHQKDGYKNYKLKAANETTKGPSGKGQRRQQAPKKKAKAA